MFFSIPALPPPTNQCKHNFSCLCRASERPASKMLPTVWAETVLLTLLESQHSAWCSGMLPTEWNLLNEGPLAALKGCRDCPQVHTHLPAHLPSLPWKEHAGRAWQVL